MAPTNTGNGYWLTAADGGVFAYGDAAFYGTGGAHGSIVSMQKTPTGKGYWFVSSRGSVVSDSYATVNYPGTNDTVTPSEGLHSYEYLGSGQPARWDPCRPVRVRLSSHDLPEGGETLVENALRELAGITGLPFSYEGLTPAKVSLSSSAERCNRHWVA